MSTKSLLYLAENYFKKKGNRIEHNVIIEGFSGISHYFELSVEKGGEKQLVSVKDWIKTVGIDTVIKIDKASEDVNLPNPTIIANKFSDHAKAYANRRKITLLTTREIKI